MTRTTTQHRSGFKLVSSHALGDSTTVTVIQDRRPGMTWTQGSVWTLISTTEGEDELVRPDGWTYEGVDLDTRFCTASVGTLLEYLAEVL